MAKGEKTKLLWQNPEYRARMSLAHKGQVPTNLEQLKKLSQATNGHRDKQKGSLSKYFKGDKRFKYLPGYHELHRWVYKQLGTPHKCESCQREGNGFHWANRSEQYLRDIKDWIRLCPSCHKNYELKNITI